MLQLSGILKRFKKHHPPGPRSILLRTFPRQLAWREENLPLMVFFRWMTENSAAETLEKMTREPKKMEV